MLHLYGDILNLYGEYGNVVLMKNHLEDQGFQVNVDRKTIGDKIELLKYDFIYMGCGTEKNINYVLKDIKRFKEELKACIDKKTVILATGNSFEMFGNKIGKEEGMGIIDFESIILEQRRISDVICTTIIPPSYKVVGYVNKMTEIYHNFSPLFKVEYGIGENKKNDYEGVQYNNFYGTHIIGPILSKNPEFLKELVIKIGTKVDKNFQYLEKEYPYEEASHKLIIEQLKAR